MTENDVLHKSDGKDYQILNYLKRKESVNANLIGLVVDSEDAAYGLYKDYAHGIGFSVRKGKNRYLSGTNIIRSKDFYCSKEGFKEFEDLDKKVYNKLETRTGCPAMIRFTVKDDQWTVTRLISEHNHDLATPSKRHLLRSARSLPTGKANVIDSMVSAGIRPTDVYSYMSNEVCGVENIGFTKRDCYNYVNKQKIIMIEAGDGQSLLNHFKVRASEDPMFFYTVQVDQENRVTNFFWRDSKSRIDYDCFGDVVVFDTTYRTNRYNLICAPFVGINNHRQTIMFGCAFLLDETADSFTWLFKSFLQSMGDKSPKTIMTDQDHAINKAIEEVFPTSCHRLCLWHISKNAPSHLGSLNANVEFHALFHKCMQGCESEIEFEETWKKMINGHNLQNHSWLNGLYKCRKKWSTAFSIDIFSSEIKSSQRAEVANNVLQGISKVTSSLTEFICEFENLVTKWRSLEAEKDFQCKNGSITCAIKNCGILVHASKVYTHEIYKRFQKEFLDGIALSWREVALNDSIHTFEVMMEENSSRIRTVQFNTSTLEIHCSCKKFEFSGYLCSHALRVLSVKNVKKLSEQYISKRWTKDAKKKVHGDNVGQLLQQCNIETETVFRNRMIRFAYDFIIKSQANEKTRQLCQKNLYELDIEVEKELTKLCVNKDNKISRDEPEVLRSVAKPSKLFMNLIKEKLKQPALGESSYAPVNIPTNENFVIPSAIMPTNSIFLPPFQNSMQFPYTAIGTSQYSGYLNLSNICVQQSNDVTPNLSQTTFAWNSNYRGLPNMQLTNEELELLEQQLTRSIAVRSNEKCRRRAAKKATINVVSVKFGSNNRKRHSAIQDVDHSHPLHYLRGITITSRFLLLMKKLSCYRYDNLT
ncbi:hypothetical protein PTKIN_Ptkin09bG0262600 [Pterospermum kingtungense]